MSLLTDRKSRDNLPSELTLTSDASSFPVSRLLEMALNNLSLNMSILFVKDNLNSKFLTK